MGTVEQERARLIRHFALRCVPAREFGTRGVFARLEGRLPGVTLGEVSRALSGQRLADLPPAARFPNVSSV